MSSLLKAENLTLSYGKHSVLWDVCAEFPAGKIVGIMGPNGAGKSSFLKAAMGIVKPLSGKVLFWGNPISSIKEKIAYVPQKEMIDWNFPITVFDVVLMGRYPKMGWLKRPREADKLTAKEALEKVGLYAFKDRQIAELSGGQQQKLFLARALAQEAEIYLMDEPFQCIDIATEKMMMDLLRKLKSEGKSIFIVHHDLKSAGDYFDELLLLNTSLVAYGKTEEVLTKENLERTYHHIDTLFDEASELSSKRAKGLL